MAATPVVCFVDADGDLPPSQLVDMARVRQEQGADIVFGSKRHDDSSVSVPAHRAVMSRVYEGLTRHMFQLDIRDTQTGIKVFSGPLLAASLPLVEETGFALDLELFVAASAANGYGNFVEFPVTLSRQGGSTVSARSLLQRAPRSCGSSGGRRSHFITSALHMAKPSTKARTDVGPNDRNAHGRTTTTVVTESRTAAPDRIN